MRSVIESDSHSRAEPDTPAEKSFPMRARCQTESNAFLKSLKTAAATALLSTTAKSSVVRRKSCRGAESPRRKPDWKGEIKLLAERKFERYLFTRDSNTFVTDDNREIGQ